jgi:L-methionine (R)-S-oxide reductase
MFTIADLSTYTVAERYHVLEQDVAHLIEGERNAIANMANVASYLYHTLDNVNWVGFYLFDGSELVLGPFHGKPACIRIAIGRGVCGTAAAERRTVVVPDVHQFPGHIACDAESRSEVVVPMLLGSRLLGVMDVDSPIVNRFADVDAAALAAMATMVVQGCDW